MASMWASLCLVMSFKIVVDNVFTTLARNARTTRSGFPCGGTRQLIFVRRLVAPDRKLIECNPNAVKNFVRLRKPSPFLRSVKRLWLRSGCVPIAAFG